MFIERDLVMLPTIKKVENHILSIEKGLNGENHILSIEKGLNGEKYVIYRPIGNVRPEVQTVCNFCILSDEEIKDGDYHFKITNGKIGNYPLNSVNPSMGRYKKIIANFGEPLKIIPSIDANPRIAPYQLPQIPDSFIEYFVAEYNKGNIITKVMVNYERKYKCRGVNFNSCLEEASDKFDCGNCESYMSLKINSDNTIKLKI